MNRPNAPRKRTPSEIEGAAAAGAKAESHGRPMTGNPYRFPGPLREAWAEGWHISREDRRRADPLKRLA